MFGRKRQAEDEGRAELAGYPMRLSVIASLG